MSRETYRPSLGERLTATIGRYASVVPIYTWLIVLVVLPGILIVAYSFFSSSGSRIAYTPTLKNYVRLGSSFGVWYLLGRTILISAVAAVLAAVIAYPMALYTSRLRRGKLLAVMLVVIPLWISLLMRVFAWRIILGENGIVNTLLMRWGIIDTPIAALLYSPFAVLLTFVYVAIPFVFISVFTVIDRIPTSLVQAANDCGANGWRAFWTVTWPMSKPGLSIGLSLGFLLAIGDYVTPSIVGGLDGTMIGTVIATQFGLAGNWSYGAALSIVLLVAVTVIIALLFIALRVPGSTQGDESSEAASIWPQAGLWPKARAALLFALYVLPFLFLYAPLVLLAVFSFNDATVQTLPLAGFTWNWYANMLENAPMMAAFRQSIIVGLSVLVISILFGTLFAAVLTYGRLYEKNVVERLLMLPLALPGIILGIMLVLTFHILAIPAGFWRLVLGHSTFVMPVIMSVVMDRMKRLDYALIEASRDLGASPVQTFFRVLLPLIASAIFGGALLGFTLSVDEVVVSAFLINEQPTLPVWVWNQTRFGFTPSVNAIFVCIGVSTFALIVFSQFLIRKKSVGQA